MRSDKSFRRSRTALKKLNFSLLVKHQMRPLIEKRALRRTVFLEIAFALAVMAAVGVLPAAGWKAESAAADTATAQALRNEEYFSALIEKLKGAKEEEVLCMYLFSAGSKGHKGKNERDDFLDPVHKVKRELIRAVKRGVRVNILLETADDSSVSDENRRTARELRRAGLKVEFDARRKVTHAKLTVIDSRYLFAGSHNLTRGALLRNNEFSLLVDSPELARIALDYIDKIKKED